MQTSSANLDSPQQSTATTGLRVWRSTPYLIAAGLFFLCILVFSRAMTCGFTNFDDDTYVTLNIHVMDGLSSRSILWAFNAMYAANWHPLTWISLMLDMQLAGLNPAMFHATNIVLHGLNTAVLFLLLHRMTGSAPRSLLVSAIFAVHPLRVESVAWVAERKDVLSVFFGLLAMHAYVSYVTRRKGVAAYLLYSLGLFAFALSLMAKPTLVTLPCVLWLLDYWPLQRTPFNQAAGRAVVDVEPSDEVRPVTWFRLILEKVPWLILAFVSCLVTYKVQHAGGATVDLNDLTWPERISNALVSYPRYLWSMIWTSDLAVFYPMPQWPAWASWGAAVLMLGATGMSLWMVRGRPSMAMGWFWFVGTLVPMIGLIQVGHQSMADRYTYFPMIGVLLAVVWSIPQSWFVDPKPRRILFSGSATLVVALSFATFVQIGVWRSSLTLFSHALAVTSENTSALIGLGQYYMSINDNDSAMKYLLRASEIDPNRATVWTDLGVVSGRAKRVDDAQRYFERALQICPTDLIALYNLGILNLNHRRNQRAQEYFERVLSGEPDNVDAIIGLARIARDRGDLQGSLTLFDHALDLFPANFKTHYERGLTLSLMQRPDAALAEFDQALKYAPDYAPAHFRRGEALDQLGRPGAQEEWNQSIALDPRIWEPHLAFAKKHIAAGRIPDAIKELETGVAVSPDNAYLRIALSNLYGQTGQIDAGAEQCETAIRSNPQSADAHYNLGIFRMRQRRIDDGIKELEIASALNPSDAEIQEALTQARSMRNASSSMPSTSQPTSTAPSPSPSSSN